MLVIAYIIPQSRPGHWSLSVCNELVVVVAVPVSVSISTVPGDKYVCSLCSV